MTWPIWLVAVVMAYLWGSQSAAIRRVVTRRKEQRKRDWLAAKIRELRVEKEIREWWCADLLEERDALLTERAAKNLEIN